ncbi:MAG: hypothetical protein HRT53_18540 [Colwellia sp.]|nr:hypothetical protein [Colwellia sp.]
MKYSILVLLVFSFGSYAENNKVLEGKVVTSENTDINGNLISKNHYISELLLKNCNFQAYFNLKSKFEISFSDRKFFADGYSVNKQKNGNCLLKLDNGQSAKS